MMHLRDSRAIASSPTAWRTIALSVLTVGRPFPLVCFRAVDTHIHALLTCGAREAAEFGRRVEISMQRRLNPGVGFAEVHVVPVVDQRHLTSTFWYALDNARRHGADVDPLFEASNLPDLLGMRVLGRWTISHARAALPRLHGDRLRELLPVQPGSERDPPLLLEAATAAIGYPRISLRGRVPHRSLVGEAADAIAAALRAIPDRSSAEFARLLDVSRGTVARAREEEPRGELVAAIEQQLELRTAWGLQERMTRVG